MMKSVLRIASFAMLVLFAADARSGDSLDWPRFRGPNGSGVADSEKPLPVQWSDTENLKWKADLPGPGSSSPVVVGDRVFVTCWRGYSDGQNEGSLEDLQRLLVALDRATGKELWRAAVDAVLPEDSYRGMFAENGYATHTPVSDGERVYAFFGKSGVHAFDVDGQPLWRANVGDDRDRRGWGSASSPILYEDLLIVTAAIENHAIVALDKKTGKEVWKQEADGFGSTWGTPVLVATPERTELVIGVPYEFWSLDPRTGKLLWYCEAIGSESMCSSVVASEGVVYGIESGTRGGGAAAVRAGGKGDVSETHVLWTSRDRSRVATPVIHEGRMYWINSGVVNCADAKTGERIYQARLSGSSSADSSSRTSATQAPPRTGRRRGFGGFGRGQDYSSPVIAGGKLYYARRSGEVYVLMLGEQFEQLAVNRFQSSEGDFHATPAIGDGELFLRSSRAVYCVAGE